jgi:NADH-quinone oxidoreductase subunit F
MLQRIESGEATPMDLDIMASVQEQIIGNCLCVLGDAMAMPVGSMIEKFRPELEAEIEAARKRAGEGALEDVIPIGVADEHAGPIPVH